MPYKDLYDHKGPYVYLLFALLETWQPLVYILEIIVCAISLYYAYKIMQLYKKNSILSLVAFACLTYFNISFHSAGAVEEFFFPMELYVTYLGLKCIKEKQEITTKQFFLIGIYSGLMLWSKFTVLGFFVGWCIVPFAIMLKDKKYKELASNIGFIILGVIAITIPAGIYLGVNGAIPDFIQTYFIDNMKYASNDNVIMNIIIAIAYFSTHNTAVPVLIMLLISIISIFRMKRTDKWYLMTIIAIMLLATYGGGRAYTQYFFPFCMFILFGVMSLLNKKWRSYTITIALTMAVLISNQEFKLMHVDVTETPQYKFAELINKEENPTLLMYNTMDYGFYKMTDITPNCKYFFQCSIEGLANKERDGYLENKEVRFYICKDKPIEFEGYELVSALKYAFYSDTNYYLYQLVQD